MLRMLRRDTSCHLLVSRVQPHAVLDIIKHPPVKHPVMLLMQATMFLAQPKRARLLVLREPTTRAPAHLVHQPAQMPMLDITCQPPVKPARPLVLLEPINQAQVNPVKPHAVLVTIKHHPVKLPVMLLMQATMFLAQPKRARSLVLLERLVVRLVRHRAQMRCQVIMYQFRVKQAQQSA